MELYQLKYFLMAAKYENISKAAQELRTSQPSVSRAIHALEEELGIELLLRSRRNVSLTYEGQLFQEKLIPVLQELDTIEKDMIESERSRKEVIRLNMLSAATILPGVIREFKKQNPNVYFKIMERKEGTQWDFCVRSSLPDVAYNSAEKLLEERVLLAVSKGGNLADKDVVTLAELKKVPYIILREGTNMRAMSDKFFHEIGFVPDTEYECDTLYLLRNMVREGLGVAIWPEISWGDETVREFFNITLKEIDMPRMYRTLYLIRQKDRKLSPIAEKFGEFMTEYFKKLKNEG